MEAAASIRENAVFFVEYTFFYKKKVYKKMRLKSSKY